MELRIHRIQNPYEFSALKLWVEGRWDLFSNMGDFQSAKVIPKPLAVDINLAI